MFFCDKNARRYDLYFYEAISIHVQYVYVYTVNN